MEIYQVFLLLALPLSHAQKDSVTMMEIERQTLGSHPVLGQLYNAHSDQLLPGFSFWNKAEVEANKIKLWHPSQETHINKEQSQDVDFTMLKVQASLSASFLGGLVRIGGSAYYLQREKNIGDSKSLTFTYQARSRTESISPSLTQNRTINVCSKDIPINNVDQSYAPTHVVSAITYGGDLHFVYTQMEKNVEDLVDVYGELTVYIDVVVVTASGKASVQWVTDVNKLTDNIGIEMYSDFIVENQPTTFNDTMNIYKTVAQNFGNRESMYEMSVPMSMQLIPIIAFCPDGSESVEIPESILKTATNIRVTLKDVLKEIDSLMGSTAAENNFQVKDLLSDFKQDVSKYTLNYESELQDNIEDARNPKSNTDSTALSEQISEYRNSKYNYDTYLYPYISERTRQINAINNFYELTINQNTPQIADFDNADVPNAIMNTEIVFLLTLNILPNYEFDSYSTFTRNNGEDSSDKIKNKWYNDKIRSGQIGRLWRDFLNFFSFNNYKVEIKYLVQAVEEDEDSTTLDVSLYEKGKKKTMAKADFDKLVQTAPNIIVQRNLDLNTMQVEVPAPANNDRNTPFKINNILVQIIQSDTSVLYSSQLERSQNSLEDVCNNDKCVIALNGYQVEYSYNISVAYNTKYGAGKQSKIMKVNGIFDEMMKTTGCIIENNMEMNQTTPRKDASTIYECAEGASGFWSYNIGTKRCYDAIPTKDEKSPEPGWATGTGSCNGGSA